MRKVVEQLSSSSQASRYTMAFMRCDGGVKTEKAVRYVAGFVDSILLNLRNLFLTWSRTHYVLHFDAFRRLSG